MNGYEEKLKKYVDGMEQMAENIIKRGHEHVDELWEELQTDANHKRDNAVKGVLRRMETEDDQISTWMARLSVIREVKMIMNGELD